MSNRPTASRVLRMIFVLALLCAAAAYLYANVELVDAKAGYSDARETSSGC